WASAATPSTSTPRSSSATSACRAGRNCWPSGFAAASRAASPGRTESKGEENGVGLRKDRSSLRRPTPFRHPGDADTPGANGQRPGHTAIWSVLQAEDVAHLVTDDRQQVHVILFALVAGRGELAVVMRRRIDEPAPAGRVVVQPDGAAGLQAEGCPAQVGD